MRALVNLAGLFFIALSPWAAAQEEEPEFTDEFPLEECEFVPWGGNPYFIKLDPGRQLYFHNQQCLAAGECDELEELWITVKPTIRKVQLPVDGRWRSVFTRVIEERETANGHLKEISRNFFSKCAKTRDIYYFGEEVDIYKNGKIVSHDGQWLAGKYRAQPGIVMPDSAFLLGMRYYQELAPGVALDRAEHVAFDLDVTVPAGHFEDCIEVTETTPLEPGEESRKVYCPGVGMVIDNDLELAVIYGSGARHD